MKRLAALILAALAWTGLARADSLDTLGQFLQNTRSARAEFTQTVQLPPRDGQAQRPKISSGLFSFSARRVFVSSTSGPIRKCWWATAPPCGCMTWIWRR